MMTLNGKEVNFEMLYTIIGKRFHQCLSEESKSERAASYAKLED